jgi:hypothetical protein
MIARLRARKRDDEASAECRASLARWSPGDVPRVVEACKDCRAVAFTQPGPAPARTACSPSGSRR